MKTCIYTICKNEKLYIRRYLNKHQDSDYICLLDTGSTDGTYELLVKESLNNSKLIVNQINFDNFRFDVARNKCLDFIPKDTDICIKVDIDEYLSENWRYYLEKDFSKDKDFYGFNYIEKRGLLTYQSKIIKAGHLKKENIEWKYPVHESLVSFEMGSSLYIKDITITHTPLLKRNRSKVNLYNKLLELRRQEYEDEDTLFYSLYEYFQEDKCKREETLSLISKLASSSIRNRKDVDTLCKCAFFIYSNNLNYRGIQYIKILYRIKCANKVNAIDSYIYKRITRYFKSYKYSEFLYPKTGTEDFMDLHILRESIENVIPYISEVASSLDNGDPLLKYKNTLLLDTQDLLLKLFSNIRSLETCIPSKRLALEILLVDHCNLNCAYCNHFASLAKPNSYKLDSYIQDIKKLKKIFGTEIWDIKLMGGEPLLHQDIEKIIKETRNTFNKSKISILTNGLLLPKMKASFWRACKKYKIKISITNYKVTPDAVILDLVHKYDVDFEYYPNSDENSLDKNNMVKFCVNEKGDTDVARRFLDCGNANKTVTLREGKIYTCPFKATICHFNDYFNSKIPVNESDYISVQEIDNKNVIYDFLCRPTRVCKYCFGECSFVPWKISNKSKEEWTLLEKEFPKYLKDSYLNNLLAKGEKG